jgi:hypothetical protein
MAGAGPATTARRRLKLLLTQFMFDSEWNWLDGEPPIDDL